MIQMRLDCLNWTAPRPLRPLVNRTTGKQEYHSRLARGRQRLSVWNGARWKMTDAQVRRAQTGVGQ